ncbi:unnamed protein product [Echinostoma caproni]|uniref:IRF tryptophan pentad repeat domain-containing protein n=1 Tax=Echinostoma caproni TaxID=27848 RepID=A0A183AIZ2_9TREM|nr:unnamed protein product [Echinostoma caproni]
MEIRVRLRPWLESRLNEGIIDGLSWIDREKGIFKIPWKHHSKHTWTEADAAIFKDWAVVTGRYRAGVDSPDWPMWKTRLRCALNKAPDIQEVRQRHNLRCEEPFKVYRFISKTESLWRANATRNASMIFDGVYSFPKMAFSGVPSQRLEYNAFPNATGKRTALIVQRVPGLNTAARASVFMKDSSAVIPFNHDQRVAVYRSWGVMTPTFGGCHRRVLDPMVLVSDPATATALVVGSFAGLILRLSWWAIVFRYTETQDIRCLFPTVNQI